MTRRGLILAALGSRHKDMVRLPGGTFRMGSDMDSLLRQFPSAGTGLKSMLMTETPQHEVTIPAYWIDRREVTNAQFQRFVIARPKWNKQYVGGEYLRTWTGHRFPEGQAEYPVAFIMWTAAMAYAEWAGKRLPTEAEWEFAARGGRGDAIYPWGTEAPTPRLANFAASEKKAPVRTGSYPANPYGLFDLAGNVWEFCMDAWINHYPDAATTQSEADIQRIRTTTAERRVIRGGSFAGGAINMRITARDSHRISDPVAHVGFRCASSA